MGLRKQKGKQDHRVCFAKGLQFSLWAWAPAHCGKGDFSLLTPRQSLGGTWSAVLELGVDSEFVRELKLSGACARLFFALSLPFVVHSFLSWSWFPLAVPPLALSPQIWILEVQGDAQIASSLG